MNAMIYPFPAARVADRNEFGETEEEQRRRACFALLEDSFGRDFADTMGAMSEAVTVEAQIVHADRLDRLSRSPVQ